jgi:hypothetical protein
MTKITTKEMLLESVKQISRQKPAKACCQAAEGGLLRDDWDGCEVDDHSGSCNGGFLL